MPVAKVLEDSFINYVSKPLVELLQESDGKYHGFNTKLRKIHFRIIGESKNDIVLNSATNLIYLITDHNDANSKLLYMQEEMFKDLSDGTYYIYDHSHLKIDERGKLPQIFTFLIYKYFRKIEKTLQDRIQKIEYQNKKSSEQNIASIKPIEKNNRKPLRQSFQLTHSDINLNLVHKILRDSSFIDKSTSFNNFSMVFSGDPVSPKVIWFNASALQYFIQEIIKGDGVKKPNEGKWERTIKCFKKSDGDFRVIDLKNTKAPVSSKTNMLDLAIEIITNKK